MLESVRCPNCATHYGLKADRVRSGIRRARCFRCRSVFGIEAEVQRLLGLSTSAIPEPAPLEAAPAETAFANAAIMNSDVADIGMDELVISPDDLAGLGQEDVPEGATLGAPTQELAEEPEGYPEQLPPSLTLGDLEGSEDEILEKTIITESMDFTPMSEAPEETAAAGDAPAPLSEFQAGPTTTGGFASARDAISKLLGDVPKAEAQPERKPSSKSANQMDVEAALDALDSTLGGSQAHPINSTRPIAQPPQFHHADAEPAMSSTVKLSHEELMEAMRAASTTASASAMAPTAQMPSRPTPPDPFSAPAAAAQAPNIPLPTAQALSLIHI